MPSLAFLVAGILSALLIASCAGPKPAGATDRQKVDWR